MLTGFTAAASEEIGEHHKEITVNNEIITSQNALGFYLLTRLENELKVINEDRVANNIAPQANVTNPDLDSIYKNSNSQGAKDLSNDSTKDSAELSPVAENQPVQMASNANPVVGGAVSTITPDVSPDVNLVEGASNGTGIDNATVEQLALTEQELAMVNEQIESKEQVILSKEQELAELKERLEKRLEVGKITQNYFYKTGDFEIYGEQMTIIADSLRSLSNNKNVKLHIIGRADPRGNKEFNEALAQKRIEFVREIATENGFDDERVSYINMGEVGSEHSDKEMYFFQRHLTVIIELK